MRHLSPFDKFIKNADLALRTLIPGAANPQRPSPAQASANVAVRHYELDDKERQHAAGLMRINHTGEVCAQALYQGQALTAKLPKVRESMHEAAAEEIDHLVWCEDRITQLGGHTSLLNPAFYGLSFGMGALAGIIGDKVSLGFVVETERQVCKHLTEHMTSLPTQDTKSKAIILQMLDDETEHAKKALDAGGYEFPLPIRAVMTGLSKIMTKSAYKL
jgi:ubiquinone biosynthesis monooxygenase Coq7